MRYIIKMLLTLVAIFLFASIANASPKVLLDGKEISFDVPPIVENGRTLVPLRAIFTALGAEVKWDNATQTITSIKGDTVVKLIIGGEAFKNNNQVDLEVPAKIVDGRTLVPLRFVGESFDCKVNWVKDIQTIVLSTIASIQENNSEDKLKLGYKIFETDDFSIMYPEDWIYSKNSYESTESTFTNHIFLCPDLKGNAIIVNVEDLKTPMGLGQYIDNCCSLFRNIYSDFSIKEISDTTLDGNAAKRLSITAKDETSSFSQIIITTINKTRVYSVLFIERENTSPVLDEFAEVEKSFKIIKFN